MNSIRFSRLVGSAIAIAALSSIPSAVDAQVVYAPSPAYAPAPVYQSQQNLVRRPRYYVAKPAARYHVNPAARSARLRRFNGYSVNGLSDNWPTGRNLPMAKPWLSPR